MKSTARAFLVLATLLIAAAPGYAWAAHAESAGTHAETYPDQLDADMQMSTAHEVEGEHGKKAGLPQFDPSSFPSQIFWLAIAFSVLYVTFSKLTLPQIGAVLQKREDYIQQNLDAAEDMKTKAENARQSYEAALKDSQEQSAAMFAKIDSDIRQQAEERSREFQVRADQQVESTEAEIDKAVKDAMDSVQSVAAEVARMAAEKIVGIATDLDQAKTAVQKIKKAA